LLGVEIMSFEWPYLLLSLLLIPLLGTYANVSSG
jgi:hypothetical protein